MLRFDIQTFRSYFCINHKKKGFILDTLKIKSLHRIAVAGITFILTVVNTLAYAQLPTHVPSPEADPVEFTDTWGSVILYIVIPAFIIIMFFIWRFRNKKSAQRKKQQDEELE